MGRGAHFIRGLQLEFLKDFLRLRLRGTHGDEKQNQWAGKEVEEMKMREKEGKKERKWNRQSNVVGSRNRVI